MKKSFLCLLAVFFLTPFLAGCVRSDSWSQKIWQDVKAADLIDRQQLSESKCMTAGLSIYVFRISTDKLTEIQELITQTDMLNVEYGNINAFLANGLISCAGDRESWQKIGQLLSQSEPVVIRRISVLVTEKINEDVVIWDALQPSSVFYHTGSSATAGIGLDTGQVFLRMRATSLIGLRQICNLRVSPVYKTGVEQKTRKRSVNQDSYEFVFDSAALNVRLQPGQFVLLAPATIEAVQTNVKTIGNIMFYPEGYEDTVNLCFIACNLVNQPL
jgi:hypothetical protein